MTFEYKQLRDGLNGGVDVIGWDTYPDSSVLAGQARKTFIDSYPDEAAARAAHPDCIESWYSKWSGPVNTFNHLPGENDPVPGGMYPDDI